MKDLRAYIDSDFLKEGDRDVLDKVRPAFTELARTLEAMGPDATEAERLSAFADAFDTINLYEDEIETVERETILEAIYDIGEIVGIDRGTEFAEEWRGDW